MLLMIQLNISKILLFLPPLAGETIKSKTSNRLIDGEIRKCRLNGFFVKAVSVLSKINVKWEFKDVFDNY